MIRTRASLSPFLRIAAIASLLLVGASCSNGNGLSGSLAQVYRLGFTFVRARIYNNALAVEFVDRADIVPVRVTVNIPESGMLTPGAYPIPEGAEISGMQGDATPIPVATGGQVHISHYDSSRVGGRIEAQFEIGRSRFTLTGQFETGVEMVRPDIRPDASNLAPIDAGTDVRRGGGGSGSSDDSGVMID